MDEKQKMSDLMREELEYGRQYWDAAFTEAKAGSLGDALYVIEYLHAASVDGTPLTPSQQRWLDMWLELSDRVKADYEMAATRAVSENVVGIKAPRNK